MRKISIFSSAQQMPPSLYYQAETFIRLTWADDPEYDMDDGLLEPATHICFHEDNTLFAYGSIIDVEVSLSGETYKCLGVRSIFTFPGVRKKGYATQVLESINGYFAKQDNVNIALLWTEFQNSKLYERAGWTALPRMQTLYGEVNSPSVVTEELPMIKFLSTQAEADIPAFEGGKLFVGDEPW